MTLEVVETVWEALKQHLNTVDVSDAADDMVSVLVDVHGFNPEEILDVFKDHTAVKKALKHYITDHVDDNYERDSDDWVENSDCFSDDFDD